MCVSFERVHPKFAEAADAESTHANVDAWCPGPQNSCHSSCPVAVPGYQDSGTTLMKKVGRKVYLLLCIVSISFHAKMGLGPGVAAGIRDGSRH